jgi:hypothetical protein
LNGRMKTIHILEYRKSTCYAWRSTLWCKFCNWCALSVRRGYRCSPVVYVLVYANSKRYIRQVLQIGQWPLFFDTDAVSPVPQPSK